MGNQNSETTPGSKTGIITRPTPLSKVEGVESDVSRTGIHKQRKPRPNSGGKSGDVPTRPEEPPYMPEVNPSEGGTTGITKVESDGTDTAQREGHPRRQ